MTSRSEPTLVIQERPQISVTLNACDEVEIVTSRIDESFERVEHSDVAIPLCDIPEVARALIAIFRGQGGEFE